MRGVLCNILVCMAVWMAMGGRSVIDKAVAVMFPVMAFVAAGFEHSIANMYLMPQAMMLQASGVLAEGQAVTQAKQPRQLSKCPATVASRARSPASIALRVWMRPRGESISVPRAR